MFFYFDFVFFFSGFFWGKLQNLSRWLWEYNSASQLPAEITQSAHWFTSHTHTHTGTCNIYQSNGSRWLTKIRKKTQLWPCTPTVSERSYVPMATGPRHVPPIVELYPPGSAAHPVRGQMSARPLAQVTTHQLVAFNPNKHWNKWRDVERKKDMTMFTQRFSVITWPQIIPRNSFNFCCAFGETDQQWGEWGQSTVRGRTAVTLLYVSLLWLKMDALTFHVIWNEEKDCKIQSEMVI